MQFIVKLKQTQYTLFNKQWMGFCILYYLQQTNTVQLTAADLAKQSLSRGFPRVIRAGHGIKIGAVVSEYCSDDNVVYFNCDFIITKQMKTWKRRFFVLNELSWAYYKSVEVYTVQLHTIFHHQLCQETEPIRSISLASVTNVGPSDLV